MKIPKKIHFIWVGGNKPKWTEIFVNEVKKINYDYEVFEWTEDNLDFEIQNKDSYENCLNMGAKSDILRMEILFNHGGIYMDYDNLQIKKFDDLLEYEFFAGSHELNPKEIWFGVVGSIPKHPICKKYLDDLDIKSTIGKNQIDRVMEETGPYYLTKIIYDNLWDCQYKIFIGSEFYPFALEDRFIIRNFTDEDIKHIRSFKKENTYSIHFHTCSWQ
jgi:mannosyltransferase OCH1-like enzyme